MIGLAISTHRRPAVLAKALAGWAAAEVPDLLVVTHDVNGDGVAATKNRGIAALMADPRIEHLFLADDDIWPVRSHWWAPYVRSGQPHLMHVWGKRRFIREDPELGLSEWTWPRGVLLYVTREVVDRVGGMRTEFHQAGEHAEWSRRIYSCGFTRAPFQDALAAKSGIWHCLDYTRAVPSSLPAQRYSPEDTQRRHELYDRFRGSTDFVEYRNRL